MYKEGYKWKRFPFANAAFWNRVYAALGKKRQRQSKTKQIAIPSAWMWASVYMQWSLIAPAPSIFCQALPGDTTCCLFTSDLAHIFIQCIWKANPPLENPNCKWLAEERSGDKRPWHLPSLLMHHLLGSYLWSLCHQLWLLGFHHFGCVTASGSSVARQHILVRFFFLHHSCHNNNNNKAFTMNYW